MRLRLKIHSWNIWNNWNAEKVVKVVVEVDVLKEAEVLVQVWALRGDETTGLFKDRQLFFLNNIFVGAVEPNAVHAYEIHFWDLDIDWELSWKYKIFDKLNPTHAGDTHI